MDIRSFASGSSGNSYYINDGETPLLIEAGIRFKEIQRNIGFKMSSIGGCLITHEHMDHARAVKHMIEFGTDCYMSKGTAEALNLEHHRIHTVEPITPFTVGSWTILPFPVQHDAVDPLGFLLVSGNTKLLYITDTMYIKYNNFHELIKPIPVTHLMIECNYALDILRENVAAGSIPLAHKNRVMRSHMSIDTLVDLLKANDLSKVEEIWLLHLSDGNSNADEFKRTIQRTTGKVVYVA